VRKLPFCYGWRMMTRYLLKVIPFKLPYSKRLSPPPHQVIG
jgi:hypothetical protein